jgi:hypothetical protein
VNPKEQETAIAELEERVDRLRILYDQYFLGFEKLEPTVPRKDVDRRFALLRKEQVRNTALRFRFNVVTQKYNTYQMYWQRICRQIEEGTFKRHVRRARARFGEGRGGEISVDVDLGELDAMDMDEVLAEAEAAASGAPVERDLPPSPPTAAADASLVRPTPNAPAAARPATAFVITKRQREDLDALGPESVPPPITGVRAAPPQLRPAPLPPGAKPRVVVRKVGPGEPMRARQASQPEIVARPPAPSQPDVRARPPAPSEPDARPRLPLPSPLRMPVRPPMPSRPEAPAAAPVAPPSRPGAPSSRSPIVVAPPMPASMRPPGSAPRVPLPPPSGPPQKVRPPMPSRPEGDDAQPPKPRPPLPSQITAPKKSDGNG